MRWKVRSLGCVVAISFAIRGASAAETDDESRAAARKLAGDAADAYDQQEFDKAQDLFHRAYELMPVPTLSIYEARCLAKIGKLVSAVEAYERTVRTPLDPKTPPAFRSAIAEAKTELEALHPRIPHVKVVVEGRGKDDPGLEVQMDGKPIKSVLLGVDWPVDPGEHEFVAKLPSGLTATESISLGEKEEKEVVLTLASPATAAVVVPIAPKKSAEPKDEAEPSMGSQKTWAYVAWGVGGAGLVGGAITGVLALGKKSTLDDQCHSSPGSDAQLCPRSLESDLDSFHLLRALSWVGFGVGVVGAGVGTYLFVTASSEQASLRPWIGVGSAGVDGRF